MEGNLLDYLHDRNLIWYSIGSAISADNNYTNEEKQKNIELLKFLFEEADSATIPEKDRVIQSLQNGIKLLQNEIKTEEAKNEIKC